MIECVCLVIQDNATILNISSAFEFVASLDEICKLTIFAYNNSLINLITQVCNQTKTFYPDIYFNIVTSIDKSARKYLYLLSDNDFKAIEISIPTLNNFEYIICKNNLLLVKNKPTDYNFKILDIKTDFKDSNNDKRLLQKNYKGDKPENIKFHFKGLTCDMAVIGANERPVSKINNKHSVILIQQYFISKNTERQKELDFCVNKNIDNEFIDKIYLLNEKIYNIDLLKNHKITQINIGNRLTYYDILMFVKKNINDSIVIFSNLDIFFDDSLKSISCRDYKTYKSIDCLFRYEYNNEEKLEDCKLREIEIKSMSQDSWIVHSDHILNLSQYNTKRLNFKLGVPRCDLAIVGLFNDFGFKIYNDIKNIRTYHYHLTNLRTYDGTIHVPPPYGCVVPYLDNYNKFLQFEKETNIKFYENSPEKHFFEKNYLDDNYLPINWNLLQDSISDKPINYIIKLIKETYDRNTYYSAIYKPDAIDEIKSNNISSKLSLFLKILYLCNVYKIYLINSDIKPIKIKLKNDYTLTFQDYNLD